MSNFKPFDQKLRRARKISPRAGQYQTVDYKLYKNAAGEIFFKIIANDDSGTYPNLYFSVSRYWERGFENKRIKTPVGLTDFGTSHKSSDKNASGFIKAVIRNIPKKIAKDHGLTVPESSSKRKKTARRK